MSPSSDVDLMVLHPGGRGAKAVTDAATALFYELWDAGLEVGHSIRTPKEALRVAREDLDAETAFLEARLVAGDAALFEEFGAESLRRSRSGGFIGRMRRATVARLGRFGDASSELEPNLKEGRGALRDLHTIGWLGRVCEIDAPDLADEADSVHRVRNELHYVTGRHADVLLMHLQAQIARAVLRERTELAPEDELMRRLYERCRAIAFALDRILWPEAVVTPAPALPARREWTPEERRAFLDLLAGGDDARHAFRALERSGALDGAVPGWRDIRALPQRNVYHRYPVDVHAFETVAAAASLASSEDDLVRRVAADASADADTLILAAFLHDIGKGTTEDHSIRGERIAREAVDRMGVPEPAASDVVWLVRHHLLLSDTATRRDIEDEALVVETAESIGDIRRLRMLYLVSVADGLATGPAAWTPWKAGLVADLFLRVGHVLERGELVGIEATELARARWDELRAALERFPGDRVTRHLASMPRAWLLSQSVSALIRQSALMMEHDPSSGIRVHATAAGEPGIWEVTVVAPDRAGLFAMISGALALNGLNVLSAQAFTRADGLALEVFRAESVDDDADRLTRAGDEVARAFRGEISVDERLAAKRRDYGRRATKGKGEPPRVIVDDRVSDFATVIEVHATDRIGLLYDITHTLLELGLDIHLAKIATYAEDVVDVFYVRDVDGQKVGQSRGDHIGRAVLDRLG